MHQSIFIMLGYPGSGKSYFARPLAQNIGAIRLSQDGFRKDMFRDARKHMTREDDKLILEAMNKQTRENLARGESIIYDANVELYADRAAVYAIASDFKVNSYILWIKTPVSTAIKRNGPPYEDETFIQAYTQMVADYEQRLEAPGTNEHAVEINGEDNFDRQISRFLRSLPN